MFLKQVVALAILAVILIFTPMQEAMCNVFQKGICEYKQAKYNSAEQYFRQALSIDPNDEEIRYFLAITLVKNKKIKEAKYHYTYILVNSPNTKSANLASIGLNLIDPNNAYANPPLKAVFKIADDNALIVEKVFINNQNAGKFVIDTGATYSSIPQRLANKLGIDTIRTSKVKLRTANGIISVPKITVKTIEINGLSAHNVEFTVIDITNDGSITGLLGLSFLNQFKMTINKKDKEFILEK